jgi:heterodisulfide reductase subunit C
LAGNDEVNGMNQTRVRSKTDQLHPVDALADPLEKVREMVQACIQCGTCSSSCPNAFAMDMSPRMLWRLVLLGCTEDIFRSKTFSLCSACYLCSLRCPRGLALTDAMAQLKRIGAGRHSAVHRSSALFYDNFLKSVRRHGRVREMELMTLYFAQMKNPLLPFHFASLGLRLMRKGKISLQLPSAGSGKLEYLFRLAETRPAPESGEAA